MMLLAVAGSTVLIVAAGSARLVDDSRQRDRVQRKMRETVARVAAVPCVVHGGTAHITVTPRVLLDVTAAATGQVRSLHLDAWWQSSPLTGSTWNRRQTVTSAWCE